MQLSEHVKMCVAKALSALDEIDLENLAEYSLNVGGIPVRILPERFAPRAASRTSSSGTFPQHNANQRQ
jgi:hypothetical protein